MTELRQYLVKEVADDRADGIVTRREAMGASGCWASAARRRREC